MIYGKLTAVLCVLFCTLFFTGCGDDEKGKESETIRPLIFEKEGYEIRENFTSVLYAISCNGYNVLDVESGDTTFMKAHVVIYENGTSHSSGCIYLTGVRKGHTSLTVRDLLTKGSKALDIKIVDFHLGMLVTGSDHPLFANPRAEYLFLVDNEQQDFYLFSAKDSYPDKVLRQGTYAFSVENAMPWLTLTVSGENSTSVSYRFDLSGNNSNVYVLLDHYFHLDWNSPDQTESKATDQSVRLRMTEAGKEVTLTFSNTQLPDGFLK